LGKGLSLPQLGAKEAMNDEKKKAGTYHENYLILGRSMLT